MRKTKSLLPKDKRTLSCYSLTKMNIFVVLLVFGLLSTALGDGDNSNHGNESSVDDNKCQLQLAPNIKLPGIKCSAPSYNCGHITCSALFSHEDITLTVEINQWSDPLSAYVTLAVPKLGFEWSHSFKDGDKIEVPGFPLEIEGFMEADVSLQLSLKKENGTIDFKVDLNAAWTELTERTYTITIVAGKLPEDSFSTPEILVCYGYRPFYNKFQALPTIAKVMIVTAVVAFVALLVIATVYCCTKKKTTAEQLKVKPPSYDEATSTKTKVPMQPLINEL